MTTSPAEPTWFDEARLGLFVHWDHASQQGLEVSWPMVGGVFSLPRCQDVSVADYERSAGTFDPQAWDPADLAARAKRAGMGYAVLTTKHHSGFALWPTSTSDWSITRTPYGKRGGDLVGEFAEACRAEGLRVGFYFSLSDWHHPDYPAWRDELRPYRLGWSPPLPTAEQWVRFRGDLFAQVRELLTRYGPVEVLWFDGGWERPADWWAPAELAALARSLQPDILLNDRLPGQGDFDTPEQYVPAVPPARRWETCLTMNDSWGWNPQDTAYKPPRQLVHTLCETAARGGNLLVNVSPRGDGSLPPEQVERLDVLAEWMGAHGTSIRATAPGLEPWQFYGPSTRRGDRVFLFLLARPYDDVVVRGLPVRRVRGVHVVASGEPLAFTTKTGIIDSLLPDPTGEVRIEVPEHCLDQWATVVALDVAPA